MTKLIPIVALVPEDTFHALNDLLSGYPQPSALMAETMQSNGWTLDAIVAGTLITFSIRDAKAPT